jgi:hypothetical protein
MTAVMALYLRQLVPKKTSFLTPLDIFSYKSSGNKAVKFGMNTYFHWDYNLTKNHSILRVSGWKYLCVDLMWNDSKSTKNNKANKLTKE